MPTDAVVTMVVAIALLWGGLVVSVAYAVRASRAARVRSPKLPDGEGG